MRGADRFKEIFEKYSDRPLLLYGDPDVDGLISLLFMCKFCDMMKKQYSYYVNSNRYHGFSLNPKELDGYMVISADFAITQEEVEGLVKNNVVLLSTDHHDIQKDFIDVVGETAEGIVINNQYPFEPEEDAYLSGAGVFYELICSLYPDFKSKELDACVGITLLSDARQIENKKARRYLRSTYSADTEEGYINYLITSIGANEYDFGAPKLDRNFIDFNLDPCVNALLRADKVSTAINFILGNGLVTNNEQAIQKSLIQDMGIRAKVSNFNNCVFLVVNASDFIDYSLDVTAYIGLFCNKYKDSHHNISTLGMVVDNGKVTRASFRGKYDDIHYRSALKQLGINAEGHPSAFGIVDFKPTAEIWGQIDDVVGDLEANHRVTAQIFETNNLAVFITQWGMKYATENCYVRDMYRSYIKYTGKNAKIVKQTYKMKELTHADIASGVVVEYTNNGSNYVYERDGDGQMITKYIEYSVDGRKVKSFGVKIEDGIILPILEKGYLQLYVRGMIE